MERATRAQHSNDLKSHAADIATTLNASRAPLFDAQNSEARPWVRAVHGLAACEETRALLQVLTRGRRESDAGLARNAEVVLAEPDRLEP